MPCHPRLLFSQICIHLDTTPASSLEDLAIAFGVDPGAIESVVTEMTGGGKFSSFKEDILIARLTRTLLAEPNAPISELSVALGYKSARAFARAVRGACGASPETLRKKIAADVAAQRAVRAAKAATTVH